MKSFSVLVFCFLFSISSPWSHNEIKSFVPSTRIFGQKLKRAALLSSQRKKLLALKHALQLSCYYELCSHPRYKFICDSLPQIFSLPQLESKENNFRHVVHFNRMMNNQFKEEPQINRRYFSNDPAFLMYPKVYFLNDPVNLPTRGNDLRLKISPQRVGTSSKPGKSDSAKERDQTFSQMEEDGDEEKKLGMGSEKIFVHEEGSSTARIPARPNNEQSTYEALHQMPLTPIWPYEVKEVIEESVPTDVKKVNKKPPSKEKTDEKLRMQTTEMRNKSMTHKKSEAVSSSPENQLTAANHRNVTEKQKEAEPPRIWEPPKHLKKTPLVNLDQDVSHKQKLPAEPKPRFENLDKFTISKIDTTEPKLSLEESIKSSQKKTTAIPSEKVNVTDTHKPILTERMTTSYMTQEAESSDSSTLLPSTEMQTTTREIPQSGRNFPTDVFLTTTMNVQSTEYFSKTTVNGEPTSIMSKEFQSDSPLIFDLLKDVKSDLKKDHEPISKNSRKMHFDLNPQTTTLSNEIPGSEVTEQRRSDILISENKDYFDYENSFSGLNYLEQLKKNHSVDPHQNWTADEFIPLIPAVLNDLREGKISSEDILTLSEAFGKYWSGVLTLSNSTNLDLLPLMKMKNEKDLKILLENLTKENSEPVSTETSKEVIEDEKIEYDMYDYMENYKDFYKDIVRMME